MIAGRSRRASCLVAAALWLGCGDVTAAEPADPDASAKAFVEALREKRSPRSAADAAPGDVWLIADALVGLGDDDAARKFTDLWVASPAAARLRAYVDSPGAHAPAATARAAIRRGRTLLESASPEAAALALEAVTPAEGSVVEAERDWLLARARAELGRPASAATSAERAGVEAEALGWINRAELAYDFAGRQFGEAFDPAASRRAFERLVAFYRTHSSEEFLARALNNAGVAARDSSDFAGAVAHFEAALAIRERIGTEARTIDVLSNLAMAEAGRGHFARALSHLDRVARLVSSGAQAAVDAVADADAKARQRERDLAAGWADHNRGVVELSCGRFAQAEAALSAALAASRRHDADDLAGFALANLAAARTELGDWAGAEQADLDAIRLFERLHASREIAVTFANLSDLLSRAGRHAEALAYQQQAFDRLSQLGDPLSIARARGSLGVMRRRAGDPKGALVDLDAARAQAAALDAPFVEAEQWAGIAAARLDLGELKAAVDAADRAFGVFRTFAFGVGDAVGISLQEAYDEMFEVGAIAAARQSDGPRTARMLETGRAGQLLTALGGRDVLATATIPAALLAAERAARAEETRAFAALLALMRQGKRDPSLRAAWTTARDRSIASVETIQRAQAAQANLVYPEPVDPIAFAKRLDAGDAFIWYGVYRRAVVAAVARSSGIAVVTLPVTEDALESAVDFITQDDGAGATDERLADLRALIVDPLRLPPQVRRVFVCPAGPTCYAPFSALFDSLTVVLVPSATALDLLRSDRSRGKGVLALGDPAYDSVSPSATQLMRGPLGLPRLPATRTEASAIARDFPPLLGEQATEGGLRAALAAVAAQKQRLRAVHFACHGLVDRDQPLHSSLALTRAGDDDGFVTTAEILRMRVPADLVVMSACQSGLGRTARGEGMIGLTRAFMLAGAPRVIASLWKVDDAASSPLMQKFYELWNPKGDTVGLSTAEALRQAQAFVRASPKWKHPRYWAAWVLWGVPD